MKNKDINGGDNLAWASEKEFKTTITIKLFQSSVYLIYFWSRYLFIIHLSQCLSIKNNLCYFRVTKWRTAEKSCWRNQCFSFSVLSWTFKSCSWNLRKNREYFCQSLEKYLEVKLLFREFSDFQVSSCSKASINGCFQRFTEGISLKGTFNFLSFNLHSE